MRTLYLAAFGFSPTVEADLVRLQRLLLAGTGAVSALALPPLVPLAFLERPPVPERTTEALTKALPRFVFTAYDRRENTLFLKVEPSGFISDLQKVFAGEEGPREGGLFPPMPGVFLAADMPREPAWKNLPPPPRGRNSVGRCLVYRISAAVGPSWWKEVEWTLESEAWMKAQARPATTT